MQQDVIIHSGPPGMVRLVIDRPKGNVLTARVMDQLAVALRDAVADPAVKLVTISGAGPHFSFGASIEEHLPPVISSVLPKFGELTAVVAESPVPVAAVVRGICFGGALELAAACHFIFAAPDARFALPEIRLGVFPPPAAAMLPMRAGQAIADRLIITGEELSGADLCASGFVTRTFPADSLDQGVTDWFLSGLGKSSASSIRHATRASRRHFCEHLRSRLGKAESAYLGPLLATADAKEGIEAYIAKRPAAWRNA